MIATGTDVKPLECLLFMRDVKSRNYFEQMKGRGTRTLGARRPEEGHALAASAKTHYVIVDAIGVTKSLKTASQPLITKPSVPLQRPRHGRDDGRPRRGHRQLPRRPPRPARTSSSTTRTRRASGTDRAASNSPTSSAVCSTPSIPTGSRPRPGKSTGCPMTPSAGEHAARAGAGPAGGRGRDCLHRRTDRAPRHHPPRQRTDHRPRQPRQRSARRVGQATPPRTPSRLAQDFADLPRSEPRPDRGADHLLQPAPPPQRTDLRDDPRRCSTS